MDVVAPTLVIDQIEITFDDKFCMHCALGAFISTVLTAAKAAGFKLDGYSASMSCARLIGELINLNCPPDKVEVVTEDVCNLIRNVVKGDVAH